MTEIFLKLLNMSIAASWVVLAVMILRLLLKKAPRWVSCLLWGLVALRLVIPFAMESPLSMIPSSEVIPQDIATSQTPAINSGIPSVNSTINPVLTTQVAQGRNPLENLLFAASMVWLVGVGIMLLYSIAAYWKLRWQVRVSIQHRNNIYVCDDVASPFVLGVFRPRIYIPSGITEEQMQYVLAHENVHIKRRDHWWKPFGFLLLTVYWFNPLLWLAYILLCRDIEQACDERVIDFLDNAGKKKYLETLVACSIHRRMIMACPIAFGENGIKGRIKGILHYKKPGVWIILASVAVCIVAAVCFLTNPKSCIHIYQSEIAKSATCTGEGTQTHTCKLCGHSYTTAVPVLAHTYNEGAVIQAPTCVQFGTKELTCTGCGAKKTEAIPKAHHTGGEPILTKEPNCTQKGEKSAICTVCQEGYVVEILETNDVHELTETVVCAATCAAAGEGVRKCTRCNHSEKCEYQQLPHTYQDGLIFEADCLFEGSKQQICTGCGSERWLTLPCTTNHDYQDMGYSLPDKCRCGKIKPGDTTGDTDISLLTGFQNSSLYLDAQNEQFTVIKIIPE